MGFCFKKNESVAKAIPRLGCERLRRAQACLEDCSRREAIHSARKEIKKARAVLRLARENISKREFRAVQKNLRKAADCLAEPRDAVVRSATLRDLTRRLKHDLPHGAFRKLRVALRRESEKAMRRFVKRQNDESADYYLAAAAKKFRNLTMNEGGWAAVAPGVEMAYRGCRAAYARAVASGSAKDFHEWRKRAKDLWHQLTLLEHIWPETIGRMAAELKTVGDYLGEDHDLFVLEQAVDAFEAKNRNVDAGEFELLHKIVAERRADLRNNAITTGKYFYAERPSQFCQRLGGYWRDWQHENAGDRSAKTKKRA